MRVRCNAKNWMTHLDILLPPDRDITVMHLGRGGVQNDGTLDDYNQDRVRWTLITARAIATLRPHAKVLIIWTGGHNRKQDRAGAQRPASEGEAALRHANTWIEEGDHFEMLAEQASTSTVENATASAALVPDNNVLVVVTDPLHYMVRKVQFIMELVFMKRPVFVELPSSPPGTNWKSKVKHLVSTLITVVGMTGVMPGDPAAIQRRQVWLQKYTGH